jgi:hypothetical protein
VKGEHELRNGKPYFLFVGTLEPRKNLAGLVECMARNAGRNRRRVADRRTTRADFVPIPPDGRHQIPGRSSGRWTASVVFRRACVRISDALRRIRTAGAGSHAMRMSGDYVARSGGGRSVGRRGDSGRFARGNCAGHARRCSQRRTATRIAGERPCPRAPFFMGAHGPRNSRSLRGSNHGSEPLTTAASDPDRACAVGSDALSRSRHTRCMAAALIAIASLAHYFARFAHVDLVLFSDSGKARCLACGAGKIADRDPAAGAQKTAFLRATSGTRAGVRGVCLRLSTV